ncbi:hypothetical protein ACQEUU_16770 [Nonomuraea sp. CA-218870]|uniref:hypothetical protein n=1 Tax=Nonomuraea sp. CA-218870 TaxID=3239998 RepID=UPI003D8AD234
MVLAAVILLIAGFVLAKPFLIMWSIVVSVLSALFLVIGALLRRHELFPGGGQAAVPVTPPPAGLVPPGVPPYPRTGPMGAQPSPRPHPYQRTATMPSPAPGVRMPHRPAAGGVSPDAIVLVIPGRKRYHVQGCRQLAGRDHEELTHEEAREEGFTACTACLPDAALGGRQLPPVDDAEPAVPAENLAEPSEPTRDLRPPVVQPKPAAGASTPGPEPAASPAASPAEAGWFGRTAESAPGRGEGASPPSAQGEPPTPDQDAPDPRTSRPAQDRGRPSGTRPSESRLSEGRPSEGRPSEGRSPEGRSQEQGRRPYASSTDEPDLDSGPDTRPQPRVTADGTPVPQRPASPERDGDPGASDRPAPRAGSAAGERAAEGERPGTESSGAGGASPAKGGRTTPRGDDPAPGAPPAAGSSSGDQATAHDRKAGGASPAADTGEDRSASREGKPGGGSTPASAPGTGGTSRDVKSGGGSPSTTASGQGDAKTEDDPSSAPASGKGDAQAGGGSSPTAASSSEEPEAETTVRTRSLFEPASPAGARRPPSSAEARGPLPQGAAPRDPRPSGSGKTGRTSEAGDGSDTDAGDREPGETPARTNGGTTEARRSATVKVIVGTRRYHSTACPLIKGAGDAGVETMTRHQAEAAGLTACSVCQHDRETVS